MPDEAQPADPMTRTEDRAIDLALSGGGFRATVFHLGLIGYLREHRLLRRIQNICSVSGGSILAAHLVTYWSDYISDDEKVFKSRVQHLVRSIMTRDVSGQVLKVSEQRILSFRPLDSELLVAEYCKLLGGDDRAIKRWDDLDGKPGLPQLHILATHLNTGRAGAYSIHGFHIPPLVHGQRHAAEINRVAGFAEDNNVRHQKIERAVAASSAFPPAFSPIPLVEGNATHLLTDGGVYDNSGVNYLKHLYEEHAWNGQHNRLVIVSDAGREFPTELGPQYETLMALALRVTDTQGDRIADADSTAAKSFFEGRKIPVVRISGSSGI